MHAANPNLRLYFTTCAAICAPIVIALTLLSQRDGYGVTDLISGELPSRTQASEAGESLASQINLGENASLGEALSAEFQRLVEKVIPSVARIDTVIVRDYFSVKVDNDLQAQQIGGTETDTKPGVGSGFIVNPQGDILTNFHVIQDVSETNNRDQIWISIAGESEPRQADILGVDRVTDLALLRLRKTDGKQFPALPLGDSDQLRMGNIVMAFGSPFGLSETATQGVISNCKRRLGDSPEKAPVIQSDVVLNPGSSGGPLINLRGEVVGINWAVYTGDPNVHSWQGIGLSIPSNDAKDSLAKLLNTKQLRGYVGLAFSDDASAFHDTRAVTIAVATPGSPAAMAGLMAGDVVLKIDGVAVISEVDAWKRVKRKKVGEGIEFLVTRLGKPLPPLMITVQDMDQDGPMLPKPLNLTKELGIWVKDADAKDLRILKTRGWTRGPKCVVITEVTPDSPLAKQEKAGDFTILEGDVIRATGHDKEHLKPLASSAEFAEILKQWKKGTPMTLNIWRDQHTESINMKLER